MEKDGNEAQTHPQTPEATDSTAANSPPESDIYEKRLPISDGGFGPLDSDDIEWLIENGRVWMP